MPDSYGARVGLTRRNLIALAVAAIVLAALWLRLYGINWDQGGLFHPDERAILMHASDLRAPGYSDLGGLFDARTSPWNPRWFNYGSLPLYLLKTVQLAASPFADWNIFTLRIPGRAISALADTAVVALVFLAGRAWYDTRTGLLASALAAFAVIGIQLSHFYAVDTLLTLFVFAALIFMVRLAHSGRRRDAVGAGLFTGLAIASKFSAVVLGVPALTALAVVAFTAPGDAVLPAERSAESRRRMALAARALGWAALAGVVALAVAQPYMVLDLHTFIANTGEQSRMVRRAVDYPYTRQYIGTSIWYQVWQLGTYGLGPVLGAAGWAGLVAAAWRLWRGRRKTELVLFAWLVPYLALTLWFDVKFMRYMLPAVPFLLVFGARAAWWTVDALSARIGRYRLIAVLVLGALLLPTVHYALAYETVYSRPHPAQTAAVWLEEHAPPLSLVLKEHWEEGIPGLGNYRVQELEMYNPDFDDKFDRITRQLATGDYLVLYSNRLFATISRLPERYPVSASYYRLLFAGDLGYTLAYSAESVPALAGVEYRDDYFGRGGLGPPEGYEPERANPISASFGWADESFTVYDHPRVLIFENTGHYSEQDIRNLIGRAGSGQGKPGLMLAADELAKQQGGGTWSAIVDLYGRHADAFAWLVWLAAILAIGLAVTPITLLLFSPLPGSGYLLAKPLGLLLVALGAWLLASLGWVGFSRLSVLLVLGALAAASGVLAFRDRRNLASRWRAHRRSVLLLEGLFVAAFVAFLFVRLANPDLWHPYRGGEKPMDFAYLNAVVRSTTMPPYDPWFGGGYLNYYYFGQFIVATLIRLTGIAPAVAYNLAVPAMFALTVGGAFTVVYALTEATRRASGKSRWRRGPIYAAVAAALLVAVAGNVDGLVQLVEGAGRIVRGLHWFGFDYWRSSRMMAPNSPGNEITEFPFFTFLFADLHAHLIAIPFTLLAVGLAVSAFLGAWEARRGKLLTWGTVVVLGVAVGALRVINSWDFPTYFLLAAAAAGGGMLLSDRFVHPWRALGKAGAAAVVLYLSGYLVFLPFHSRFELFNNGLVGSETRTPLWRYMAVHAAFLAVVCSYLVWQGRFVFREAGRVTGLPGRFLAVYLVIPLVLFAIVAVLGYATVAFTFGLILVAAVTALLQYRSDDPVTRHMLAVTALIVVALAIGCAVDIVTVTGDIGRMNTVFKFYLQAWVLFALATAYLLWRMFEGGLFSLQRPAPIRAVWMASLGLLALAISIYPVLGTRARIADRFDTSFMGIDGTDYMDGAVYQESRATIDLRYDKEAIRWLQENIQGSPVLLEGITDLYRWGNRVAVYTGLPDIVGWDWHQRQQRVDYAWAVTQRRADVDLIFTTTDANRALTLMRQYGVQYVYVGELERQYYPASGLEKFDRLEADGVLNVVHANERVTIYRLGPEPGAAPYATASF